MITGFVADSASAIVYSTWNPADRDADIALDLTNLLATAASVLGAIRGTLGRDAATEHRYFEITITTGVFHLLGLGLATAGLSLYPGADFDGVGYYSSDGNAYVNDVGTGYGGATYTTGDVIGVELDNGDLIFWKNGVSQGVAATGLSGTYFPMWGAGSSTGGTQAVTLNVGETAFGNLPAGATEWE